MLGKLISMEESLKILYALQETLEKSLDECVDFVKRNEYIIRIQTVGGIIKLFEIVANEIELEDTRKTISDTFHHE